MTAILKQEGRTMERTNRLAFLATGAFDSRRYTDGDGDGDGDGDYGNYSIFFRVYHTNV